MSKKIARESFVALALLVVISLVASCAAPTPVVIETEKVVEKPVVQTVVIEKEKVVEKPVVQTVVVEKVVTATPVPVPQVLRVGQVGDIKSMEPYRNAAPNYLFIEQVFDQLLCNEKNEGFTPEAAISVELAPDNLSCTVTLREGLVTHDGSPVDAEMLRWDFEERVLQKDKGVAMYNQVAPYFEKIEVVDDHTLAITFNQPVPMAKDIMTLMIVADPDMFVKDDGEVALGNQEDKQIATGPFKMVEYVPGSHMKLERFEDYWEEGYPKLDEVIITYFGDNASMMAALEAGEIDLAFRPPYEEAARFMDNPDYTVWLPETKGLAAIMMVNPEREYLRDPRVRQAINLAINREAISQAAFAGMGLPMSAPLVPSSIAYTPELEIPPQGDPEKAKALLEEAGVTDLSLKITYASNDEIYRLESEVIAANLQEIGINVELDPVEKNIYIEKRVNQDFDMLPSIIGGTNGHPALLQNSFVYRHEGNQFFDDIEPQQEFLDYVEYFNKGMAATSEEEARDAWQKALKAVADGAWVDTLVGQPFIMVSSSHVKGITWTEQEKPMFKYAYIE